MDVIHVAARRPHTKGRASKTNESFFAARLIEHLAIPAFVLDAQGCVLLWNRACERLTGVPGEEVIGSRNQWKAFYDRERPTLADLVIADRLAEATALYEVSSDPGVDPHGFSAEAWCTMPRARGQLYLGIDVGPIFDERGHLVAVVETLRDLTAKKQKEAELLELAQCDALTSIANRRAFDRRLEEEWTRSEQSRTPVSLLLIDVDGFKHCNDNYGHAAGDLCLRHVAEAIRGETRHAGDLAARIGGDEFAAILPNTPIEAAMAIAERIRLAIARVLLPVARPPSQPRVTVSIGVAESLKFRSCEAFLAAADAMLYRAKASGRNRTVAAGVAASHTRVVLGQPPARADGAPAAFSPIEHAQILDRWT